MQTFDDLKHTDACILMLAFTIKFQRASEGLKKNMINDEQITLRF